jgi:hypothetical protein
MTEKIQVDVTAADWSSLNSAISCRAKPRRHRMHGVFSASMRYKASEFVPFAAAGRAR